MFIRRLSLLFALLLFALAPVRAGLSLGTIEIDDANSTLTITSPFSELPPSGFLPLTLKVKNNSSASMELDMSFSTRPQYSFGSGIERVHKVSLEIDPGSTLTSEQLVPCELFNSLYNHGELMVSFETRPGKDGKFAQVINTSSSSLSGDDFLFVALSNPLHNNNASRLNSGAAGGGFYEAAQNNRVASFNPEELPANPAAYSGVDVLILTRGEWLALDAAVRRALRTWMHSGGLLAITRPGSPPMISKLGLEPEMAVSKRDGVNQYHQGFGKLALIGTEGGENLNLPLGGLKGLNLPSDGVFKLNHFPSGGAGSLTRFLKTDSGSRALLVLLLVAFAIVVGPVNLFVLAPAGRRHRLFITTPVIALGTSLLLAGGVFIADGFGGDGERIALVEIESLGEANQAHIFQEQVAHAGIIFGASFEVPEGSLVRPFRRLDSEFSQFSDEAVGSAEFNFNSAAGEQGTRHSGDWFSSRSDVAQQIRSLRPGRGEVTIKIENGGPVATNSFNFTLEFLRFRDDEGGIWYAKSLPTGTPTPLTKDSGDFADELEFHRLKLSPGVKSRLDRVLSRPNRFVGFSSDLPLIDTLESIDWTVSSAVVTGTVNP